MGMERESAGEWKPFPQTVEDLYGAVAQYYDAQWLSFRTALYRLTNFKKTEGFR
jgi:hypothetical protein